MATDTRDGTALVARDGALDLTGASSLPKELSAPSALTVSLRVLVLARQSPQLRVLPEALRALTALELLDVRGNLLETLPAWVLRERTGLAVLAEGNPLHLELPAAGESSQLFEDASFPADARALFRDGATEWAGHVPADSVRWLRPHELCPDGDARLIVRGTESADVVQGCLGSCWFLSAVAVVAMRGGLAERTFALAAGEGATAGQLPVQLWKEGRWRRVTIDDRLPCDADGSLLYARSAEPTELWVSLLEKAYAKAHGSYEALISGFSDYALRDLTGGAPQRLRFGGGGDEAALWQQLRGWAAEGAPIGCAFSLSALPAAAADAADGARATGRELLSKSGLLRGHAYAVEAAREVAGRRLVRLRNPWGYGEWRGAWSDGSKEWTAELLQELGHTDAEDGSFWMEVSDFAREFNTLYTARRFPDGWGRRAVRGEWAGAGAAGCPRAAGWRRNPCVRLVLREAAEVYIVVSQRDARVCAAALQPPPPAAAADGAKARGPSIGFVVLSAADVDAVRRAGGAPRPEQLAVRGTPLRAEREVASDREVRLGAGAYALVPFTFAAGEAGAFEVEVFCSAPAAIELELLPSFDGFTASGLARLAPAVGGTAAAAVSETNGGAELWQTAAREVDDDDVLRRWGHMSPAELIARYRAEDDAAARAAALADAYLRQQVEELRAERRATGGPPPDLKPAADGLGAAPIMGAAPVVLTGIAQNGGGRGGGGRGGGRGRGGGGFVQRSYDQRSRNARADDILEAVMQRSRRR